MSEAAKLREMMRGKAKRLTSADPHQKVDSSSWTPPEPLNADVKTGMRPVSRRAYKKGGKVMGECGPTRADRKPRKSGGKAAKTDDTPMVDRYINRDLKKANEYREGIKHVGALKTGGRAAKAAGGSGNVPLPPKRPPQSEIDAMEAVRRSKDIEKYIKDVPEDLPPPPATRKQGGRSKKNLGGVLKMLSPIAMLASLGDDDDKKARGGRSKPAKKNAGGLLNDPRTAGDAILQNSAAASGVSPDRLSFAPGMPNQGMKKFLGLKAGGKTKHPDEAMDKALIKKMVKASARKARAEGGATTAPGVPSSRYGSAAAATPQQGAFGAAATPQQGAFGLEQFAPPGSSSSSYNPSDMQQMGAGAYGTTPIPQGVMDQYNAVNQRATPQQGIMPQLQQQYMQNLQRATPVPDYTEMNAARQQVGLPIRDYAAENTIIPEAQQYNNYANQQMAASRPADPYYMQPDTSYDPEYNPYRGRDDNNKGGRVGRKKGGGVFSGSGYPDKIPGVVPGGRIARKSGGKAKGAGKTNINIVIAGKPQGGMEAPMPPMPPPGGPAAPPPMGGAPGMPPGMPPGLPPAPPMGGPGPMGRKAGGRAYKSYKDMDAGAGSGLGRLEKSEVAKRTAHKAGGRAYKSYKDMDAGSGSGLGRLEKTEIASRSKGS